VSEAPRGTETARPLPEAEPGGEVDWDAIERGPEYRELRGMQRRFIVPATVGYLVAYFGFLLLAGLAPDFMGTSVYGGITVAFVLLAGLFVLVWALVRAYVRIATTRWDAQAARVVAEVRSEEREEVAR
jgi:uncharacterized membrane protein (DUF485 family)